MCNSSPGGYEEDAILIPVTHEEGGVSLIPEQSAQVRPDIIGNADSCWFYTQLTYLVVLLCSIASCVFISSLSSALESKTPSHSVVIHDYLYLGEERLKGCIGKLTD